MEESLKKIYYMKNYPKETAERMATHLSTNETYSEYS